MPSRKQAGPRISVAHVIAYQAQRRSLSYRCLHQRIYSSLGFATIELWLIKGNRLPSSTYQTHQPIIHHGSSKNHVCRVLAQPTNTLAAINRPAQRTGTTPSRPPFASTHPNQTPRPRALANCAATSTAKCVVRATRESQNSKPTKTAMTTNTASA
jgi:hypothetical protein